MCCTQRDLRGCQDGGSEILHLHQTFMIGAYSIYKENVFSDNRVHIVFHRDMDIKRITNINNLNGFPGTRQAKISKSLHCYRVGRSGIPVFRHTVAPRKNNGPVFPVPGFYGFFKWDVPVYILFFTFYKTMTMYFFYCEASGMHTHFKWDVPFYLLTFLPSIKN